MELVSLGVGALQDTQERRANFLLPHTGLERVHKWSTLPVSAWFLLVIYVDSFFFIFVTALLKDIGLNKSQEICDGGILLCLFEPRISPDPFADAFFQALYVI